MNIENEYEAVLINNTVRPDRFIIFGDDEIEPYDREVLDSVISLYAAGSSVISPLMILKIMTGNPNVKLHPTQKEAINNSMQKLYSSRVTIRNTKDSENEIIYRGHIITAEKMTTKYWGEDPETRYSILRMPIRYEYAKSKKQVAQVPIKLFNSPIRKNEETIILQGYLIRRILAMKGNSSLSKIITCEAVYNQINLSETNQADLFKKKHKVRNHIKTIFDYWKQEKFIFDYVEVKKGNSIFGFLIVAAKIRNKRTV